MKEAVKASKLSGYVVVLIRCYINKFFAPLISIAAIFIKLIFVLVNKILLKFCPAKSLAALMTIFNIGFLPLGTY